MFSHDLRASTHSRTKGLIPMPTTNGTKVSRVIFSRSVPNELTWPLACINSRTSSGVNMTPKMFESAALKIAPDVLPLATEVRTTDVETVDGNTHRYRKPSRRALGSDGQIMRVISWKAKPTTGNRRKVKL